MKGIKLNGSGWLIVDPLSGYLNFCGYEHKTLELPALPTFTTTDKISVL